MDFDQSEGDMEKTSPEELLQEEARLDCLLREQAGLGDRLLREEARLRAENERLKAELERLRAVRPA